MSGLALVMALLVLLASCTGSGNPGDGGPRGRTVPPVAFQQITGLPPERLSELKTAMAVAGGERDIGFVEGQLQQGSFSLSGDFRALAGSSGVRILYQWQLRDAQGVVVQTIAEEESAGLFGGADPWGAVTAMVLDRIARRSTETIARKLSDLGYAARVSALYVPPAEYFAMAGPGAQREVDFETLNGPGMAVADMDLIAPAPPSNLADVEAIPGEAQVAAAPQAEDTVPEAEPDSPATKAEAKVPIRAVAVMQVKGSPGGGDAELTAAMRRTLADAGWPVVTRRQPDALTIVGRVKVAGLGGAQQSVSVRWEVQSPDGKTLGDVKQANQVPAGSLDRGWGQAAFAVAEAAATGIFDIVNRFQ